MKHYVLLNFEEGFLDEEFFSVMNKAFSDMQEAIAGMTGFEIRKNIVERDSNADVMLRVDLKEKEDLKIYLEHPLHVEFAQMIAPHKVKMTTFDCE